MLKTKQLVYIKKILIAPLFLAAFLISAGLFNYAHAGSATLSWNANTESDLSGYKIYYGTSPRAGTDPKTCVLCGYSSSLNVGNVATYTFNNLTDGTTYYFSVSAYDTSNNESAFSAEVSKVLPPAASYVTNLNFTPSLEGAAVSGKNFTVTIYQGAVQVAQFTAQPNAQNQIPLPAGANLASGAYNLTADAPSYLRARQTNISLASNSTVTLSILKAGDLNNDGTVNSLDWSTMNSNWWSNSYPSDINQDGVVNSIDFSWLNKNWLLTDA